MNNELTEREKKQWESFRRLIDDENPIVRKALITEISRFPETGKLFLEYLIRRSGDIHAKHAHSLIA